MWFKKNSIASRKVIFGSEEMKKEFIQSCTKIANLPISEMLPEATVESFVLSVVKMFEFTPNFFITLSKEKDFWEINNDFLVCRFDFERNQINVTGGERGVATKTFKFNSRMFSFIPVAS